MRPVFAALLLITSVSTASAATVDVKRVWPGYRTAASFERMSEYFTGRENTGREIVLRTQPSAREGYYFVTRLTNPTAPIAGATFELRIILPTSPHPVAFTFVSDIPSGSRAYNLGLTGSDWPAAEMNPVAWQLTIRGPDGGQLAQEQSFLWSKPETNSAAR